DPRIGARERTGEDREDAVDRDAIATRRDRRQGPEEERSEPQQRAPRAEQDRRSEGGERRERLAAPEQRAAQESPHRVTAPAHARGARGLAHAREQRRAVALEVCAQAPDVPARSAALPVPAKLSDEDAGAALEQRARERAQREAAPVLGEAVQQEEGRASGRG